MTVRYTKEEKERLEVDLREKSINRRRGLEGAMASAGLGGV